MKRLITLFTLLMMAVASYGQEVTLPPVANGATSVILPCITLWSNTTEGLRVSGISQSTAGLEIRITTNVSSGWVSIYTQAGATIENITTTGTLGVYETPTTGKVRFQELGSGSGCYQLQFHNFVWGVTNATRVNLIVSDTSTPTFKDASFVIDQDVASVAEIVAGVEGGGPYNSDTTRIAGSEPAANNAVTFYDTNPIRLTRAIAQNDTTIATLASQTSFTLTAGSPDNDTYNGCTIMITDQTTSTQFAMSKIQDYVGGTKTITLRYDPNKFIMAVGDLVTITCL